METLNNSKSINYSFIAVPTQLFILLDYRLKLVLTSLIQVSTALANSNGWFYYSKEDLKKLCGIKNDKTIIACFETFYRLNLLEVQARTFKNNVGSRTANYYRINFNEIEKYNEYSVYECMNILELQIAMLDYTSKDYQTTYTAATDNNSSNDEVIPEPTETSNNVNGEIPSIKIENAPVALETINPAITEKITLSEHDETEVPEDCPLTLDKLRENDIDIKRLKECKEPEHEFDFLIDESEEEIAESPSQETIEVVKPIELDGQVIETASVFPTDLTKVEKRSLTNDRTEKLDDSVKQKCEDLVKRYVEMVIPSATQSLEMSKQASLYIIDKYNKGYIDIETKDKLVREVVCARFEKFPI